MINIFLLNTSGNLTAIGNTVKKTTEQTVDKVKKYIPVENIDIVVRESDFPKLLFDVNGVGAYCPSGHYIQISIDRKNPKFLASPSKILEKSLIHELHHAVRNQFGIPIDERSTFLECLFSEGLADRFVHEITGALPSWTIKLPKKKITILFSRAKKIFKNKLSDEYYCDWFIKGSKSKKIPKWSGYALGYYIVEKYLAKNPKESAYSLISKPVNKILSGKFISEIEHPD